MSNGGMKFDGDKPQMQLLFGGMPHALEGVGAVLTFGAKKYAAHSWKTVPNNVERYKSAMLRHQLAIERGETHDQESGQPHAYHIACNALFLAELAATSLQRDERRERDDRAGPVQQPSGPADDSGRDRELVGNDGAVGGGAGRAEAEPRQPEKPVPADAGGLRRDPVAAQALKQALCQHTYTFIGFANLYAADAEDNDKPLMKLYRCAICNHTYETKA